MLIVYTFSFTHEIISAIAALKSQVKQQPNPKPIATWVPSYPIPHIISIPNRTYLQIFTSLSPTAIYLEV
jgi:hypothetical protein